MLSDLVLFLTIIWIFVSEAQKTSFQESMDQVTLQQLRRSMTNAMLRIQMIAKNFNVTDRIQIQVFIQEAKYAEVIIKN